MPRSWPMAATIFSALALTTPLRAATFYAPPAPDDDTPIFSGQAEFGYTRLTGNTDSETLLAKGRLTWLTGRLTHSLRGEVRRVEEDDDTSAEQYLFAGRERYDLEGPHYLFGFARWERDRFSGYRYQLAFIGGYGRQLLAGPSHFLSVEAGPGYRRDALESGEVKSLAVGYGALDYEWELFEGTDFQQEISVEGTSTNVITRSFSALTTQLNASLALRISHEVESNFHPPDSADESTDQTTAASLLYHW